MNDIYQKTSISHSLYSIYEGKIVSYFVENLYDDDLLSW